MHYKLLFVDDLHSFKKKDVLCVSTVSEAIKQLQEHTFEVVSVDYFMVGEVGQDLLDKMFELKLFPEERIWVHTGDFSKAKEMMTFIDNHPDKPYYIRSGYVDRFNLSNDYNKYIIDKIRMSVTCPYCSNELKIKHNDEIPTCASCCKDINPFLFAFKEDSQGGKMVLSTEFDSVDEGLKVLYRVTKTYYTQLGEKRKTKVLLSGEKLKEVQKFFYNKVTSEKYDLE